MSQKLRSSGILEAYEKLLTNIYQNGWPGDKSIYNHAAEEILRYGSKHQQEFKGVIGKEIEKKSRAINATLDIQSQEPTPKNIISMERDPNAPPRARNHLDLSIFDKPRVQLSKSIRDSQVIRDSRKEDEALPLNFSKPDKKDIILTDNPDFNLDKNYYEQEFKKPPEEDEDLLRMSMKSGHKPIDRDAELHMSGVKPTDLFGNEQPIEEDPARESLQNPLGQTDIIQGKTRNIISYRRTIKT